MSRGTRNRDKNILDLIRKYNSRVLMEIGVWRCVNSVAMIEAAAEQWPIEDVIFYGFDVFSDISVDGDRSFWKREKSSVPWNFAHAKEYLGKTGANIQLFQGESKDTVYLFVQSIWRDGQYQQPDFVWLDGGHTYETVASDWYWVRRLMENDTIVLIDDYAIKWRRGKDKWGVNRVVDSINRDIYAVEFLDPHDPYKCGKDEGTFCIVKVTLK